MLFHPDPIRSALIHERLEHHRQLTRERHRLAVQGNEQIRLLSIEAQLTKLFRELEEIGERRGT